MVVRIDVPGPNAEICLGATITPKITVRNTYTAAQNIRVRLSIDNATRTGNLYDQYADLLNIPAGKDTTVTFANFVTGTNVLRQLGRQVVTGTAVAINSQGTYLGDANVANDTIRSRFFGLRRTAAPFIDPKTNFSAIGTRGIPEHTMWVSFGASVVEGDVATFDPSGPRDDETGFGPLGYHAPVMKLDRRDESGVFYTGTAVGDTLTSFPINLQGATKMLLSFDYQRSGKRQFNAVYDIDTIYGAESTILTSSGGVQRVGDSLILEFKDPGASACDPSASSWRRIAGIDGGKDVEFKRFSIAIESKNTQSTNYFTTDFRFRLRLKAKSDPPAFSGWTSKDNDDAIYIDNVAVSNYSNHPEVSVDWVRVATPYTKVPASQAIFPIYAKISNYGPAPGYDLPIIAQVLGPDGKTKYFQRMDVKLPTNGRDTIVRFPNWDASGTLLGATRECKVIARIAYDAWDWYTENDEATSTFFLPVESHSDPIQEFAYDDAGIQALYGGNDWSALLNRQGQGIGFNNTTGSYAVKFKLMKTDTLYGVRIYFGRMNAAPDAIRISTYYGTDSGRVPGAAVNIPGVQSYFNAQRRAEAADGQFWTYYFPKPLVLQGALDGADGNYWLSVSQLALDNMAIGADISRGGADMTVMSTSTPTYRLIHQSPYGTMYDTNRSNGDISRRIAVENTAGSGNWTSMDEMWYIGNASTLNKPGLVIPMIRPMVSKRILLPVEFVQPLRAIEQEGGALLTWITAMEKNNAGFRIERRNASEEWTNVGFVTSRTPNASTPSGYSFVDRAITAGTYIYRLVQIDLDGTESISTEAELTLSAAMQLAEFSPTPFDPRTQSTRIALPTGTHRIRVIDPLGRIIIEREATGEFIWNGRDAQGNLQSPGAYIIAIGGTSRKVVVK